MEIKNHIKIILLLVAFQAFAVARYETINEQQLCTAAKFIMAEDDQRQTKFNTAPIASLAADESDLDYRPHTAAINAKINGKVNTKRKASMETKRAVTLAILGTALTENGDMTEITQKFKAEKASLKTEFPDNYRTNILYLHRLALYTIEVLANSLVKDALNATRTNVDTHFRNLTFLTGIKRDAFMELFGMAQSAHQTGLDTRKNSDVHVISLVPNPEEIAIETSALDISILPEDPVQVDDVSHDTTSWREVASAFKKKKNVDDAEDSAAEDSAKGFLGFSIGEQDNEMENDSTEEDTTRKVNPLSSSETTAISTTPSPGVILNVQALGIPSGGATLLHASVSSLTQEKESDSKSKPSGKSAPTSVELRYNWTEEFQLSDGRTVRHEPGKITVTSYSNKGDKKHVQSYPDTLEIKGKASHKITIPVQSTKEDFISLLEQTKLYGQTISTPERTIDRRASTGSTSFGSGKGGVSLPGKGSGSLGSDRGSTSDNNSNCTIW